MSWLFRPSTLILASVVLAITATMLVFWPTSADNGAIPLTVSKGDQEVVWLYSATSGAQWERFVAGIDVAVARLGANSSGLELEINKDAAFPLQTTAIPEVSVGIKGGQNRLRFRWYKLTSDLKSQDWVQALLHRKPPPLAIIGGNSSDQAIELAHDLQNRRQSASDAAPLLLLATSTADDEVDPSGQSATPLTSIYAERTLRFCFTNRQMALTMVDFLWSRDDLRPDADPVYLAFWADDPYSNDLSARFLEAVNMPLGRTAARDWAAIAGFALAGGLPLDFSGPGLRQLSSGGIPQSERIEYSVGTFDRPNRWEAQAANSLMDTKLTQYPMQRRPLLIVTPAATQPARRFLRGLVRAAPSEARRFVVATGDGVPFNAIYRDRNVTWPIQDLPFSFLLFCHRNPVDESAGFRPEGPLGGETGERLASSLGTEDLLLNMDIVATILQASFTPNPPTFDPAEIQRRMRQARWSRGQELVCFEPDAEALFDADGNRRSGTGEHIVYLRPASTTEQVQPKSIIEVWSWQRGDGRRGAKYQRQALLHVQYDEVE
jgi:hypothetical protein